MSKKIIYYQDEINDDFASTNINTKPLRENYIYVHKNIIWRAAAFVLYRIIAQPLVFAFVKIAYHQRFENKSVLKAAKNSGAYIYANHTNSLADAFIPNILRHSKKGYIVVGPDAMSIPCMNNIIEMLGGIPLGSTLKQSKETVRCIKQRIAQKNFVTIYPEAHIWPYYTKIRDFSAASFGYAADGDAPVFAMTTCYQKRRFGKRPKAVTYLDGPFYPDSSLPVAKRKEQLRNMCHAAMSARAEKYSTYEYITYIKKDER